MSTALPIRPELADARPYRWQEDWETTVPAGRPVLRFDQNTQPRAPAWYAGAAARLARIPVQSYPDARYRRLRETIAAYTGHPPHLIVPTAGADEALVLSALLALRPGDRAYARSPYYAMFDNATRLAGGELSGDPDGARLAWICTPHNPTGEDTRPDDLEQHEGLVVIDQAYVEFGGRDLGHLVGERDNTLVVRTLSKAFAVAAARVGYVLAPESLAVQLDAIRPPGSISSHSVALAELALDHVDVMRRDVAETVSERERMATSLRRLGFGVPDSATNFLFVDLGAPAAPTVRRLLEHGMVVRTYGDLPNHIRINMSVPSENDQLLAVLGGSTPAREAPAEGRRSQLERRTRETFIECALDLDGTGRAEVTTGIGFLDHMLTSLAFHSMIDLRLICAGDLWVDEHHTVEDVAIVLGGALDRALGERAGIARFGDARAPLDEALCHATVDLGGRGVARLALPLAGERIGELPSSLLPHFFDSLSRSGRLGIHLEASGNDDHHVAEAAFKSLALALRRACSRDERRADALPSTKGAL
jgi:imidazoleglycerol phosphate dehydratase HisB/histidinol-phosphate/aromatic aminotransferase/cobyric acid decarboxylase-like protein